MLKEITPIREPLTPLPTGSWEKNMKKYNLAIGNRFGIHHTGIVEAENMKDARLKAMRIRTDEGISGWIRLKYVKGSTITAHPGRNAGGKNMADPLHDAIAKFKETHPKASQVILSVFTDGFVAGRLFPFESVARDIWEAAEYRIQLESEEELAPDFETFYKQLIEGK